MKEIKTKYLFVFSVILIMFLMFASQKVYAEENNTWVTKSPMSDLRIDHQVVVEDNRIYVMGGSNSVKGYLSSLEVYDAETNNWTTLAPMSDERAGHKAVSLNGKIYVIGGHNNNGDLNSLEVYDTKLNTWIIKASMNTARCYPQVAIVDGKIYVIGGYENGSYLNSVEVYDPSTNSWDTKAPMTDARVNHQAAVINGKIYVVGGENSSGALDSLEVFDPVTNTWEVEKSMSTARLYHQIAVLDDKLFVTGGENSSGYLNSLEVYDPTNNTWTMRASMTSKRADHQLSVINGELFAIGGTNGDDGYLSSLEVYNPTEDSWTTMASMNVAREMHQAAIINNKIYVIGGSDSTWGYLNSVEEYTIAIATNKLTVPTGLTAIGGDKKVHLSWTSVTGSSISIKRSTSAEGPYMSIANNITKTTFTDTTVTNGTTYYYVVSAISSGVEGKNSNIAFAIPQVDTVMSVPTGLIATDGDNKVKLSWKGVAGATSYNIKRSETAGGPYITIANCLQNNFIDKEVTNNTTYYYVVTAVNAAGESTYSKEASSTPSTLYAILEITFSNGMIKEFYISNDELENFLLWYDNISSGIGKGYFLIHSNTSISPYKEISSSIQYKDILYFDAKTYTK